MSKMVIDTINTRAESAGKTKLDINQTAFLEEQLTQITGRVLEVKYPALKGRSFVPLSTDYARGAEYFKSPVYDQVGMANIIASNTTNLNLVNVIAKEQMLKLEELGVAYEYTVRELEGAAFAGVPLTTKKGEAAKWSIERAVDSMIATGGTDEQPSAVTGRTGLLNNANVPSVSFDYDWNTASADEILQDLNKLANQVITNSKTTFMADTVILSPEWFTKLSTQSYSGQVPDSILKVFVDNHPSINTVDMWTYCTDFVSDGEDRAVAYMKDPMILHFGQPVVFEEQAPQIDNFVYKVPVRSTIVPTVIEHPLGVVYGTCPDRTP